MRLQFWLSWRYLSSGRKWFNPASVLAIFGMALGVSCLIVAMAVVSGFRFALKKAIVDVTGDVVVAKSGSRILPSENLPQRLKQIAPQIVAESSFIQAEAVIATGGHISGVMLEGLDPQTQGSVLRLQNRVVVGALDLHDRRRFPPAVVGEGIWQRMHLHLNEIVRVVIPNPSLSDASRFHPRMQVFRVKGVVDLGKNDFNKRIIITTLAATQRLLRFGDGYSGLRLKLTNSDLAPKVSALIAQRLGYPYWTRDWHELNQNLLEAAKLEKVVIFFVVLIMVIAACFNISSTLFVTVLRRYSDIGILQTMGAGRRLIVGLFAAQGLLLGFVGAILGVVLGVALCLGFAFLQTHYQLLPGQIYKVDGFTFQLRVLDMAVIIASATLICFLSTLAPARRGAKLSPVEGLRYE